MTIRTLILTAATTGGLALFAGSAASAGDVTAKTSVGIGSTTVTLNTSKTYKLTIKRGNDAPVSAELKVAAIDGGIALVGLGISSGGINSTHWRRAIPAPWDRPRRSHGGPGA